MTKTNELRTTKTGAARKLIAALCFFALAGLAQTASIDWRSKGYLWNTVNNEKATSITGGIIALCLVTTAADGTESYELLTHGNVATSGDPSKIGTVGSLAGFACTLPRYIQDGDVLTVLLYDATTEKYRNLYYVDESGQVTDKPVTDRFTISGIADGKSYLGTFTFATEGNFTTAIPEPTSGLLLLVGLAGLALRRRRL